MDCSNARNYTPSLINFDKPRGFMEDVKDMVISQITKEQNRKLVSPSWVRKAQENLNHTGEQPLIVQQYLAPNKREQEDGVLPATKPTKERFLSKSAGSNDSRYHHSVQPHQFLAATMDIPNYRNSVSDYKYGRPTKASLLRSKQRHQSAPSVRATIKARTGNNCQKNVPPEKNEERCRSMDIPDGTSTTNGETLHQFLVGARYNRGNYHDAKCLSKLGLYVCRKDTGNSFMQSSVSPDQISSRDLMTETHCPPGRGGPTSSRSSPHGSIRVPPSLLQKALPLCEQICSPNTDSPSPSQKIASEDLDHAADGTKAGTAVNIKSRGVVGDGCVLCQSGIPLKGGGSPAWSKSERRRFDPAKRWAGRRKNAGKEAGSADGRHSGKEAVGAAKRDEIASSDVLRKAKEVQQMVFQQYHLRIMGTKVGISCSSATAQRIGSPCRNKHKVEILPRAKSATARLNDNNNNQCACQKRTAEDIHDSGGVLFHISAPKVVTEPNLYEDGGDCYDSDQLTATEEGGSIVAGGSSMDKDISVSADKTLGKGEHLPINKDKEESDDR